VTAVYTLVCTACHRGWTTPSPEGTCMCGRPGILSGAYQNVPLERRTEKCMTPRHQHKGRDGS